MESLGEHALTEMVTALERSTRMPRGVVLLDVAGRPAASSAGARAILPELASGSLPAALRRWAADPHQRDRTLWLSSGARTIVARFVRAGGERRHDAIVLRQAGGPPGAGIGRPSLRRERLWEAGLTAREAEVLEHVGHGATTAQVAAAMSLSPRTVEKHLQHIYRKLGVCNRTQALTRLDEHMGWG